MSRGSPSKLLSLSFADALAATATAASVDLSVSGISVDVALATQVSNTAELIISNADVAPDGYTRAAVVVNGQSPGPLITGNKVPHLVHPVLPSTTDVNGMLPGRSVPTSGRRPA